MKNKPKHRNIATHSARSVYLASLGIILLCNLNIVAIANVDSDQHQIALSNNTYVKMVNGIDGILEFNEKTTTEEIIAFKELVNVRIPSEGEAIKPYLFDKIIETENPKVIIYAALSLSKIEKLSQKQEKALEAAIQKEFGNFHTTMKTKKGRQEFVDFLEIFYDN